MSDENAQGMQRHWEKTRTLTMIVLVVWVIFAFIVPWNAKALNNMSFMGFPLGYYFLVQGSLAIFVALIWIQNWRQDQIDDEFGIEEEGS